MAENATLPEATPTRTNMRHNPEEITAAIDFYKELFKGRTISREAPVRHDVVLVNFAEDIRDSNLKLANEYHEILMEIDKAVQRERKWVRIASDLLKHAPLTDEWKKLIATAVENEV